MQVRVANKLAQAVRVSVKGSSGKLEDLCLGPFETSRPLDEEALGAHARQLVASGYLKVRQA